MYDTLLFPTDGTQPTDVVLEHARTVAAGWDATVHVLYVVDDRPFLLLDDDRAEAVSRRLQIEGESATSSAAAAFQEAGVEATREIRTGTPANEIVDTVLDRELDLVVMGTHGDDPTQNLLGSTAEKVVMHSPVPVLTVGIDSTDRGTETATATAGEIEMRGVETEANETERDTTESA